MTATVEEQSSTEQGGTGRVVRVIGPVVDVEFAPDEMPEIHNALHLERTGPYVPALTFWLRAQSAMARYMAPVSM